MIQGYRPIHWEIVCEMRHVSTLFLHSQFSLVFTSSRMGYRGAQPPATRAQQSRRELGSTCSVVGSRNRRGVSCLPRCNGSCCASCFSGVFSGFLFSSSSFLLRHIHILCCCSAAAAAVLLLCECVNIQQYSTIVLSYRCIIIISAYHSMPARVTNNLLINFSVVATAVFVVEISAGSVSVIRTVIRKQKNTADKHGSRGCQTNRQSSQV